MPTTDKFEIRNDTGTLQSVDAPGAGGSKKLKPDDQIEVTASVATGFYGCAGWALLKNGKEIGPGIDEKEDEKPKGSKPYSVPKPPRNLKPAADIPADEE